MPTLANFVRVTLFADITAAATEIRFDPATAPFNAPPDPAGRTAYALILDNLSAPTAFEIVSYTRMEFNRLRGVTRGADGTTARSWTKGAYIAQDIPAALAEPLGLEGAAGEVLKVGSDGSLSVGAVNWSEIAGVIQERGVLVLNSVASPPAIPASGEAVMFAKDLNGRNAIAILFDNGTTKTIATDA